MRSCGSSIALIIAQQFLFAVDTMAIHSLGSSTSLTQIGFLRSIGGMALVLCVAPTLGYRVFYTQHPFTQAARAFFSVGYTCVLILSYALMPLIDATALGYVSGLYVVFLAGPLLGEVVGIACCAYAEPTRQPSRRRSNFRTHCNYQRLLILDNED